MRSLFGLPVMLVLVACSTAPASTPARVSPAPASTPVTAEAPGPVPTQMPPLALTTAASPSPPLRPTAQPSPAPVVGGMVTELIPVYPRSLNPVYAENESELRVSGLIFDGLMSIDPFTRLPVPDLADGYLASSDGLRYTFRLKPGLLWHDGTAVTAEDVVWTYRLLRQTAISAPLQPYARRIRSVTAVDDSTVRFTLTEPYAPFLARLGTAPLLPRSTFRGLSGARLRDALRTWDRPVGTGPFRFDTAEEGVEIALTAFSEYHEGAPYLSRYHLQVVRDANTARDWLVSGEADLAWLPAPAAVAVDEQDFLTRTTMDTASLTLLLFNLDSRRGGPLLDQRVRRALAHALNLGAAEASDLPGLRPTGSFQPPASPAHEPGTPQAVPYDTKGAATLLRRAGWAVRSEGGGPSRGEKLSLTLLAPGVPAELAETLGDGYRRLAGSIAADWRRLGIDTRVRTLPWEQLLPELLQRSQFDAVLLTVTLDADPDQSFLWSSRARKQGLNVGEYNDPELDRLLAAGLRELDFDRRRSIYQDVEAELRDYLPAIPIGVSQAVLVRNVRVVGPSPDYWSVVQHSNVHRWWVVDGR